MTRGPTEQHEKQHKICVTFLWVLHHEESTRLLLVTEFSDNIKQLGLMCLKAEADELYRCRTMAAVPSMFSLSRTPSVLSQVLWQTRIFTSIPTNPMKRPKPNNHLILLSLCKTPRYYTVLSDSSVP